MKKHISYPKIVQFRNIIQSINRVIEFAGLDGNGEALYDKFIPKPTLTFKGTVKLHGTNAAVCIDKDGFWVQSRSNIITQEKDNAGFAFFAYSKQKEFELMFSHIIESDSDLNLSDGYVISIYGEWAGKGIQKGVGISELNKAFYIFGAKISKPEDENFNSYWIDSSELEDKDNGIYNIEDFETYSVDVDFNMPQLSTNKFTEITEAVEAECPVSKFFGIDNGVGEGVVWSVEYKDVVYRFKVKGDKHSVSKVKTLVAVDIEKLNSVTEFVEYSVTENRFKQAIENVFSDSEPDVKKLGDMIKWVISDIISEESDTLSKNGLEPKDIGKYVAQKVREMFFKL